MFGKANRSCLSWCVREVKVNNLSIASVFLLVKWDIYRVVLGKAETRVDIVGFADCFHL